MRGKISNAGPDRLIAGERRDVQGGYEPIAEISAVPGKTITVERALSWWVSALRLWRVAPARLTVLCMLPLLIELVLQLIPTIGVPLSKVVVPFVGLGLLAVFNEAWTTRKLRLRGVLWSFRSGNRLKALQLSIISASVFVVQLISAAAIFGAPVFDAILFGRMSEHPELMMSRAFILTLILPGVVPDILLLFAGSLVVLEGRSPVRAAMESIRVMASSVAAFAVTCVISALLLGAALMWAYLMILVIPWMSLMGYAAYRSVFVDAPDTGTAKGA